MKIRNIVLISVFTVLFLFIGQINGKEDVSTFSNYDEIVQTFINLELNANFDQTTLYGNIMINFLSLRDNLQTISLDSRDLEIYSIVNQKSHENLSFNIDYFELSELGSKLNIQLNKPATKGEIIIIKIYYSTKSPSKSNVNANTQSAKWLSKEMTLGKNYPFMFTESEKILSRTLFPCQDTPSVKTKVKLTLTIPLNLIAVFGGTQYMEPTINEIENLKTYYFEQEIEIPTYLIAFAVGDLESRKVSDRVVVIAEPGILETAKNELNGFEDYIKKAEEYLFENEWGVFNVLVLPPGNPYGAMENPNLVYVPQTLIVGDQSLLHVLAHELAHSWTGNLVTNSNWNDFWLNEGFAVFVERKLVEFKLGEDSKNLHSQIGLINMQKDIDRAPKSTSTSLYPDVSNHNPDNYGSYIPYEKGYNLLVYLENYLGKESFQKMLREYLLKYRFKSVSVSDFLSYFNYFLEKFYGYKKVKDFRSKMNLVTVIHEVGNPSFSNDFVSSKANTVRENVVKFVEDKVPKNFVEMYFSWEAKMQEFFLMNVLNSKLENLKTEAKETLEKLFKRNMNDEMKNLWFSLQLKMKNRSIIDDLNLFLASTGRMKFLTNLYSLYSQLDAITARKAFNNFKYLYLQEVIQNVEKGLQ